MLNYTYVELLSVNSIPVLHIQIPIIVKVRSANEMRIRNSAAEAHPGAAEAHPRAAKTHPGAAEAHNGVRVTRLGAEEAHSETVVASVADWHHLV